MKLKFAALLLAASTFMVGLQTERASAQEYYVGQIILGGWNFCPRSTTGANGQLLAITENEALFSLYGTNFGGDGRTTFGLPDLRGRAPLNNRQGPGLTNIPLGSKSGRESFTDTINTMASHTHAITNTTTATANVGPGPAGAFEAGDHLTATASAYAGQGAPNQALEDGTVAVTVTSTALNTGGQQPVNIRNPYLGMQYCVVLFGIYPSRS